MGIGNTVRQISLRAASLAFLLAALAALTGRWPEALGVLMGCLVALLNFRLLAQAIPKLLVLSPLGARKQATGRYLMRYTLTVLVLLMVNANPNLNVYATLVGLLLVKVVILGEAVFVFAREKVQDWFSPARWKRGDP